MLMGSELWAKTGSPPTEWHALPCHLLDVGAAAELLFDTLPLHVQENIAAWLDTTLPQARAQVVFLAAAHDIGKANPYFQAKDASQAKRLRQLAYGLRDNEPFKHGQATGAFLKSWLQQVWGWPAPVAEFVALAVGGHHGKFFSKEGVACASLGVDQDPWCRIGVALLNDLAHVLGVEKAACPRSLNSFLGWLSGFVTVADWLGSHKQMTVWQTGTVDLQDYLVQARVRAKGLLNSLQWTQPVSSAQLRLADLLPVGAAPKELQLAAERIAGDFTLAIVEAPTGEGKTEAAFALAEPARSEGAGTYFALPTMATANGLHGRVADYLAKATGDDEIQTRLLHSQSWLFRDVVEIHDDEGDQAAQAEDWFAGSKRGLIAPYGVGTIDQALIAALKAKHGFVRLFALAGKVVVIDEVHAYDLYMADLMDVLLGWLRALGCKVALLSATLPASRREELLNAWGVDGPVPTSQYPCITWVDGQGEAHTQSFSVQERKPLTFTLLPIDEKPMWQAGADEILNQVRENGGLGALVLNTVGHAQAAYLYLKEQALDGIQLDLFHARFTVQDRDRIEKHVLAEYGKHGVRDVPRILVATQVVEQSLDLDFDQMVTALAPIDLLIQRAGRLHRHARYADGRRRIDQGPDERTHPIVYVISHEFNPAGETTITDFVYAKSILLLTLAYLVQSPCIATPQDVARAVEGVYSEAGSLVTIGGAMKQLGGLREAERKKADEDARKAERAAIGTVGNEDYLIVEQDLRLDENDERHGSDFGARTRLEDRPSVALALLQNEGLTIHGASTLDRRNVMFSSLRCSPPIALWKELIELGPLPRWGNRGALSRMHALTLPYHSESHHVDYDPNLGLTWTKNNA